MQKKISPFLISYSQFSLFPGWAKKGIFPVLRDSVRTKMPAAAFFFPPVRPFYGKICRQSRTGTAGA
jgi:hypothetical protein